MSKNTTRNLDMKEDKLVAIMLLSIVFIPIAMVVMLILSIFDLVTFNQAVYIIFAPVTIVTILISAGLIYDTIKTCINMLRGKE